MAEKFTFTGKDGQSQTIEGVPAFKAFLAQGGLAYLEGLLAKTSGAQLDPAREAARALMQGIVDGTVDPLTADLDELETAYLSYQADTEIAALFERAVDVVMEAAAKATEGIA